MNTRAHTASIVLIPCHSFLSSSPPHRATRCLLALLSTTAIPTCLSFHLTITLTSPSSIHRLSLSLSLSFPLSSPSTYYAILTSFPHVHPFRSFQASFLSPPFCPHSILQQPFIVCPLATTHPWRNCKNSFFEYYKMAC